MLVFNEILVNKSVNILNYINKYIKNTDVLNAAGFLDCNKYSFSYMFTLDNDKVIELRIEDKFDHFVIEYKLDSKFIEIAEFGAICTMETEIDIDFLNESFLNDLESKTLSIEEKIEKLQ